MDCHDALLQLEAARAGSDDVKLSEFDTASAHLDGCLECRTNFQTRQMLDRRISEMMLDVPVPSGLKERLLESLNLGGDLAAAVETGDVTPSTIRTATAKPWFDNVRNRIVTAVGLSACLLVGLFFLYPTPPERIQFTLDDARDSANLNLAKLDRFDNNFQPLLPMEWRRRGGMITVIRPPKGDLKGKNGAHRCASYAFSVGVSRGRVISGVLLVIPRSVLDDEPASSVFLAANASGEYFSKPNGKFGAVAWKSGDFVYVCFMPVGHEALEKLEKALYPPPV